jgi:hypothetical protein
LTKAVANASDGVDEFGLAGKVNFVTEKADEGFDRVFIDVGIEAPHGIQDGVAGDDAAGVAEKKFKKREFAGGEGQGAQGAGDLAGIGIERKIGEGEADRLRDRPAAADGADAGEQHVEGEGFGEVIVGSEIEGGNQVTVGIASGEHEDGSLVGTGTETAGDGEAIHEGKHDIEHNGVEGVSKSETEGGFAIARESDVVTLFGEALLEKVGHSGIVFGYKELHFPAFRLPEGTEGMLKSLSEILQVAVMG